MTMSCCAYSQPHYDLRDVRSYHPPNEPLGLFITSFQVADLNTNRVKDYKYRIYCPTKRVREITDNQWGKDRYLLDEDTTRFNGALIIAEVIVSICE
ncbi:hypothetical protein [Thiospirillum jenense]|uniref:hypothetical protein n=1 Tax=Thiospirillum jenense TaxID=1653858 RepID=UPI001EEB5208|nr:hypothetical protein [Thiospirillum jenense]